MDPAQISIDTTKPKMRFAINGHAPGGRIIDDIVPEIGVRLSPDLSGFGNDPIQLEFKQRPDGVTPPVSKDQNSWIYKPETQVLRYKVPLEENTLLFPGDQWVRVTATDKVGNKSTRSCLCASEEYRWKSE